VTECDAALKQRNDKWTESRIKPMKRSATKYYWQKLMAREIPDFAFNCLERGEGEVFKSGLLQ